MSELILVFIHGYSVTRLDTYGGLPQRLKNEALLKGIQLRIEDVFLGRYISFNDDIRLDDVSRALDAALKEQVPQTSRFICITHSTGGPVVRNWWDLFYRNNPSLTCPMSHLIMLAPANHGSTLAQLGKTRLSRIKSWFDGVEPGQKILDWLELGSSEAWKLNVDWIEHGDKHVSEKGIFPFVITGQDIDRRLYDHINSYTGELGSDGVVRVASANLNNTYIQLRQSSTNPAEFEVSEYRESARAAMRVLARKSHSGDKMGIMKSVASDNGDEKSRETVEAIFACIQVKNKAEYTSLCDQFHAQTNKVQTETRIEIEDKVLKKNTYIHDRYTMVIFRLRDSEGYPLNNFDLVLTGPGNDPDMLPTGFFADRQCNRLNPSHITYFFNYDIMNGTDAVVANDGEVIRKAQPGINSLGLQVHARPDEGFVRYLPCRIEASRDLFEKAFKPNGTTLIDICLKRIVSKEVLRFEKTDGDLVSDKNFKDTRPGENTLS